MADLTVRLTCPDCGEPLRFTVDRLGETVEHCGCGARVLEREFTPV